MEKIKKGSFQLLGIEELACHRTGKLEREESVLFPSIGLTKLKTQFSSGPTDMGRSRSRALLGG